MWNINLTYFETDVVNFTQESSTNKTSITQSTSSSCPNRLPTVGRSNPWWRYLVEDSQRNPIRDRLTDLQQSFNISHYINDLHHQHQVSMLKQIKFISIHLSTINYSQSIVKNVKLINYNSKSGYQLLT